MEQVTGAENPRGDMKVGICAVPKRLDNYVKDLVKVLEPECSDINLFIDEEMRGQPYNYRRMFTELLEGAEIDEPILLCTDDVITIEGWREYWEDIHRQANDDLYVLFSRQRHLFTDVNLDKGYVTKCQLRGLYDQAVIYINQHHLPKKVDRWFAENRDNMKRKRHNHFDVVIQDCVVSTGKEYTILTPSLFEHIGELSTLGHGVGKSVNYIGDYHIS